MRPLTPEAALEVWERGHGASATERALNLLAAADPTVEAEDLGRLPLGERDRRLLELRTATLGPDIAALSSCPHCSAEVEVRLQASDLLALAPRESKEHRLQLAGGAVRFRLPTSEDLHAAAGASDASSAEEALFERCLVGGEEASATALSASDRSALAEAMSGADPLAEIHLDLSCAVCGESWQELFEIADFFFEEVAQGARRLIREVGLLARGYGWDESAILSMSPLRRRAYRELLGV